jgi:UDP-N-acetylglucosamine:LPS N-acetylglucosamine transferase
MAKIKITSEQYNKILIHEQNNRLASSNKLNEGDKEVVLAVSKLMGLNLSGLNKEIAEKALKDKTVMDEVLATFGNETKMKNLASNLEEKGMENANEKLSMKAKDIVDNYNKISKENNFGTQMGMHNINKIKGF